MPKALVLVGSHLACLLAGGYFLNAATASRDGHGSAMAATKSGNREATATPGSTLAHDMVTASRAPLFDAGQAAKAATKFGKGEGEKKVHELTAHGTKEPTDTAEFAAALLAWFREDPNAAFAFMQAARAGNLYDAVLVQALKEMPLDDHLKLSKTLLESPGIFRVGEIMGERLAALSPAEAAAFFKSSGIAKYEALMETMIGGWPADKVDRFLELAMAMKDPNLLQMFLDSGDPRKQAALLVLMDSRDDLAQAFPNLPEIPAGLRGHLYRYADPSVPLDERIAQMKNLDWLKNATPEALARAR